MTICIQCALEAYVASEGKADMTKEARFDESPEEHTKRCHPDLLATRARRRELEREFARIHGEHGCPDPECRWSEREAVEAVERELNDIDTWLKSAEITRTSESFFRPTIPAVATGTITWEMIEAFARTCPLKSTFLRPTPKDL